MAEGEEFEPPVRFSMENLEMAANKGDLVPQNGPGEKPPFISWLLASADFRSALLFEAAGANVMRIRPNVASSRSPKSRPEFAMTARLGRETTL